jgi:hypothetical protein
MACTDLYISMMWVHAKENIAEKVPNGPLCVCLVERANRLVRGYTR